MSVASVVPDVVGKTPLMRGYFEGKRDAEACLRENYAEGDYFIVKPSFIYGGDAFSLTPPRVTKTYGDVLAKVLGSGPVKALAAKAPGPIALTLAEPVSVEDVAGACVAGAMGTYSASNVVDGTDDIKKARRRRRSRVSRYEWFCNEARAQYHFTDCRPKHKKYCTRSLTFSSP